MAVAETSYYPPIGDASLGAGDTGDVTVTDTGTTTTSNVVTYTHQTTGTAAAGFGTGAVLRAENGSGTNVTVAALRAVLTTVTNAAEVGDWRLSIINSGTLPAEGSEQLKVTGAGVLTISGGLAVTAGTIAVGATCTLAMTSGSVVQFGSTGTKIGNTTTGKFAFWNATPVAQWATTGTSAGFTAGGGTTATHLSTFTGNNGSTAYTIGDVVNCLKTVGFMAA